MQLHELKPSKGSRKNKKIVGRGPGSGSGKTAGRGANGQMSRSGHWSVGGSEGGQNPLIRRLPKIGFTSHHPFVQVVNVEGLNRFADGEIVNTESLKSKKLINSINRPYKILGRGEITKKVVVKVQSISKSASEKIEKAGGKVEVEK